MPQPKWDLAELADKSSQFALDGDSKRIRWQPNGRQIRYYTTLGLLDRPLGGRGRKVKYGPKHLLQLLAIKRLQQQGLKLAEIQPMLAGLGAKRLTELLGLPQDWLEQLPEPETEPEPAPSSWSNSPPRRETNFWESAPRPVDPKTQVLHQLELAPGVHLQLNQEQMDRLSPDALRSLVERFQQVWKQQQP